MRRMRKPLFSSRELLGQGNELVRHLGAVGLRDDINSAPAKPFDKPCEILRVHQRVDALARVERLFVEKIPLFVAAVCVTRARRPLQRGELFHAQHMVEVAQCVLAVEVIEGLVQLLGEFGQIGERELLVHVGRQHRGHVALNFGELALAQQRERTVAAVAVLADQLFIVQVVDLEPGVLYDAQQTVDVVGACLLYTSRCV